MSGKFPAREAFTLHFTGDCVFEATCFLYRIYPVLNRIIFVALVEHRTIIIEFTIWLLANTLLFPHLEIVSGKYIEIIYEFQQKPSLASPYFNKNGLEF